jgi:hypothetical protein
MMSDTIKWSATSDREKTRLILDHVLGYFIVPDQYVEYGKLNLPRGRTLLAEHPDFHWPLAFWNSSVDWWQARDIHTDPVSFDPLRDLNDTWLVIEHIMRLPQSRDEALEWCGPQFALWMEKTQLWACTKEQAANEIGKIALQACGVEVEA